LYSDKATNCGGGVEEWRLYKTINLTGVISPSFCFGELDSQVDINDGVLVYASDATHQPEQIFCINGPNDPGYEYSYRNFCAELPAWASQNPAVRIEIVAHSETAGHQLLVDELVVLGENPSCDTTLLTEDFNCTPGPLPNPFNGWTVSGTVLCGSSSGCHDGSTVATSANSSGALSRTIDTTGLYDIMMCVYLGDNGAMASGEEVAFSLDTNDGNGWQTFYYEEQDLGVDGTCRPLCFDLSGYDSEVDNNPNLKLEFYLASNNAAQRLEIDHITIGAGAACPAAGAITLGPISEPGNDSEYYFDVTSNIPNTQTAAWIRCYWGDPSQWRESWYVISYIY
jgi:hypothetical protein